MEGAFMLIALAPEEKDTARFLKAEPRDWRMSYTRNFSSKIKSILVKWDFLTSYQEI